MLTETFSLLAPEIMLVATAVAIYMAGVFVSSAGLWRWIALLAIAAAAVGLALTPSAFVPMDLPLTVDTLGGYLRWLALGAGVLLLGVAWRPLTGPGTSEYVGSLLLAIAGTMLVASARDLVLLFVALEMVSIPTYILLYLGRRNTASQEAAVKYFYLSILSSAILLYGFSFLYGAAGSMDLETIRASLASYSGEPGGGETLAKIALGLILAGLGFRIAAVPFHFYAPDVYQGTTHGNAALLSVLPKIVGFAALVRVVAVAMSGTQSYAWPILMVIAALTMTLGNVLALWQNNVRRLLAYSSIAHAGYLLIGLTVALIPGAASGAFGVGVAAMLFYLLVYALATIGAFAVLAIFSRGDAQLENVDELAGLAWSGGPVRPMMAWLLAIFMLSLTGIPPLAGFWGKLALFAGALGAGGPEIGETRSWLTALAVVGVVNSAISAAYYLRVVATMFFRMPPAAPSVAAHSGGAGLTAVVCAVLSLFVIGFYPGPWMGWADVYPANVMRQVAGLSGQANAGPSPRLPETPQALAELANSRHSEVSSREP